MHRLLILIAVCFQVSICFAETAPLQAVPGIDVARYAGRWYEIAKFPNRFQQDCVSDTSALYSALPDSQIQVLNRCTQKNGETKEAVGQARQIGGPTSAILQVRFAPWWLSFLPMVWGDYWVIDLDDRYELVAVSEPRREFLWILARTPHVSADRYQALLARLAAKGFDVSRLLASPQSGKTN